MAQRAGVELATNCRVREVTVDARDMATGVVYYDENGVERRQRAEVVVMACNGVGTPRLLLNSVAARFPRGLANRSGLVGKNLMLHPWGNVTGRSARVALRSAGVLHPESGATMSATCSSSMAAFLSHRAASIRPPRSRR